MNRYAQVLTASALAGRRAIFNDTSVARLGTIRLIGITTVGQVQLLARDTVRSGRVEVDGLDIMAATLGHVPNNLNSGHYATAR